MPTSDDSTTVEERALTVSLSGLATSLKSCLSKIIQKVRMWWRQLWQNSSNKEAPKAAMVSTSSDDALDQVPVAGTKIDRTESISATVDNIQLSHWKTTGKSVDDVFTLLKLDQAKAKLFDSPGIRTWYDFVILSNTESPEWAMYSTLTLHYSYDELATALAAGMKNEETKGIAELLQSVHSDLSTRKTNGESVDEVFNDFKLGKTGAQLFESLFLNIWATYVKLIKTNNWYKVMFDTIYKSDVFASEQSKRLALMFAARDEDLAVNLQLQQLKEWHESSGVYERVTPIEAENKDLYDIIIARFNTLGL